MGPLERAWRGGKHEWRLHVLSVFSVAVAFVCLASALLVIVNVDGVRERWARAGHASVYLKSGVSPDQIQRVEAALRATQGIERVRFVSSEDARRELLREHEDEVIARLSEEAFPPSLELELVDEAARQRVQQLSAQLQALPMVDAVETYGSWAQRIEALLNGGLTAALVLGVVVLAAVVSVVSSTIRLTLQRRRAEVEVLRLVGATESYVRRPFVIEGAAQGAVGALLAVLLLAVLFAIVRSHFDAGLAQLLGMTPVFLPWSAIGLMLSAGGAFGALAAHHALRHLVTT